MRLHQFALKKYNRFYSQLCHFGFKSPACNQFFIMVLSRAVACAQTWAWVTSALNEHMAEKAIVLACSLKRVQTAGKLVVITSPQVPEIERMALYKHFDLVYMMDTPTTNNGFPTSEDHAKVFAFSLSVFQGCVYLSPNSLVLKNCDEIITSFCTFPDFFMSLPKDWFNSSTGKTSMFIFVPSTAHFYSLRKTLKAAKNNSGPASKNKTDLFTACIKEYAENSNLKLEAIDKRFFYQLKVSDGLLFDGSIGELSILNFGCIDPRGAFTQRASSSMGLIESFAIDRWWNIYHNEIHQKTTSSFVEIEKPILNDRGGSDKIAIVGISCRLPGANNLDEFWNLLKEGHEGIKQLPSFRWQKGQTITPASSKCRKTKAGFLDFPIDEFDANLRGSHVGMFIGSWLSDYKDMAVNTVDRDFFRLYMGNSIAATSARLSFLYGVTGPSIGTESGCSSAIVAIDMACKSLRNGETNLSLAGGVNLILHPFDQAGGSDLGFGTIGSVLAPDARCKTFSCDANGFGRAEGVGVLVLKRLSDAIADGDKIWALIRGSAISQEGVSKSIGTPTIHCESLAMELALKDANVEPKDVSFVEAHGTGTSVGDPIEIAAITKVYSRNRTDPLFIGSVKTNLGHTEAASGVTGIIKVILQLQNNTIAPHLNFSQLNPEINLDDIPAQIPLSTVEWKRNSHGMPRLAGVSSFGISGTDGHAIIEEAPYDIDFSTVCIDLKLQRPSHIMKITAKTSEALDQLLVSYQAMFEEQLANDTNSQLFSDIAYSANAGRATFNHRAVIVAKDVVEAAKILKSASCKRKEIHGRSEAKICFLFTGQGSQYRNMAQELYSTSPVFRLAFDKCNYLLENRYNVKICQVMWDTNGINGLSDVGMLDRTLYSQIAIFVVEYCLLRMWESWGVKPDYVMGHSLGEFAAAICCGALTMESAIELVVRRSQYIDSLPQGKMLVLKLDQTNTEQLLHEYEDVEGVPSCNLEFAALNSPEQTVLAGDVDVIGKFKEFCNERQVKCIVLATTHAFHSKHMDPILEKYRETIETVIRKEKLSDGTSKLACKFISGTEGRLITDMGDILTSEYWVRHTREKVKFLDASKVAYEEGCNVFLEIGPSPILSALMRNNVPDGVEIMCLPSLRKNQKEWITLLDSLSKLFLADFSNINIDWKGFDQYYLRRKVSLPFYPFQRKKIWVDFTSTPAVLHPLVGRVVPNASKSTIFESDITLKQFSYLNDHAIGNTVIFPGAALLEMCAVAGHCAVQGFSDEFCKPRRGILVKGLRIEAPLALYHGKACRLQTVIDLNDNKPDGDDGMGYCVKVYNWFQEKNCAPDDPSNSSGPVDGQWKSHASACFLPLVTDDCKPVMQLNIEEIQEKWEKLSASKDLYEKLPEVGLRFGANFQSLLCGWKQEKSENFDQGGEGYHEGILFEVKVPTDDYETYLVHPVILDAMLQASMLLTNKDRIQKKLQVPIHIQEFAWLSDGDGDYSKRFVFSTTINGENDVQRTRTLLLDGSGSVLASMTGIEFIETTVKLVESAILQQSSAMPQIWEEIWKPKRGPRFGRAVPTPIEQVADASLSEEIVKTCSELNELDENEIRVYHHLDDLTLFYFLNALYKLGWEPKLGDEIVLREFMNKLGIVEVAWNFMRYFFSEMVHEGFVEVLTNEKDRFVCKFVKLPRSKEDVEHLCLQTVVEGETSRGDYKIISEMGKGLVDFLNGKSSPLSTLFPEDPSKPNLGHFYDEIRPWVSKTGGILNDALTTYNHLFYTKDAKESVIFRVLEVGSGTGSGSKHYLEFLESKKVDFEYTFTDISAAFFINAEVKFEKYKKQIQFKKFNIEKDALAQGLFPAYYDLIIACEVIHATKDIKETLRNLRMLLKTHGHIQITETTKPDRRITLLVGLLEGYWPMTDLDLRPTHATLSPEKWISVLKSTGYCMASSISCYKGVHSYIFAFAAEEYSIETGTKSVFEQVENECVVDAGKTIDAKSGKYSWLIFCDGSSTSKEIQKRLTRLNRSVIAIDKKSSHYNKDHYDPEVGKQKIFRLLKKLEGDSFEGVIYMWALSPSHDDGQEQLSLPFLHLCQGFLELHKATARLYVVTRGAFIGLEDSECQNPTAATVWGIAKTLRNEQPDINMHCIDASLELSLNDQIDDIFDEFFWTNDGEELRAFRDGKRLVPRLASLKITDDSLSLPPFCDRFQLLLPSTKAIADLEFGLLNNYKLVDDEIEVQVKCCALNFRDIFAVLKPTSQFDEVNSIGSDFAGVVTKIGDAVTKWKVGDPVFGMNTEQQALPSHLKTKENMVIRVPDDFSFSEAATIPAVFATALYCLVKVAKIQKEDVCLIHTASGGVGLSAIQIAMFFGATVIATAGSRRKRAYLRSLGIQHVFHSRNTEYGDEILNATGGRGVDIVLNSLTGPGFIEASIKACTKHARFVEMSKLNIWTEEKVHELRQDIEYTVADLTSLEKEEWTELMEEMINCMKQNCVKPIPYVQFDALRIRQALSYLQKAKHIGKVVCVMPEKAMKESSNSNFHKTLLFNDRSTYLITGGIGGIGFEIAKFMLNSGAKYVILVSRSVPKPEIEAILNAWNEKGKKVEAWRVDVGNFDQVGEMLNKIKTQDWPPLRGIMHAAGVLSDGTLPNQSWEKFQMTYNAKVRGTENLHALTKDHRLEHFVMFSSVTSLFGSPGQCNHSASNAFEDAFAHYRHSIGLHATTVNFANWGEVGVATEIDFPGIRPIATSQGLRSVEAILKSNRLQTCVMNVDSFGMVVKLFPKVKGYLEDKRLLGGVKAPTLIINTDQFWGEVDNCDGRESKIDVFKRYIKNMLKSTLKMDPDENIEDHAEFQGLGVDSLMLLEMKNYLQNLFGKRLMLTAAHLKDCNTTVALACRLVDMLEGKNKQDGDNVDGENNAEDSTSMDKDNSTTNHVPLENALAVG